MILASSLEHRGAARVIDRMGFFFGLIGYVTAVALMVGGAVFSALWVTRPLPPRSEQVVVGTGSAKRMHGANAALTKGHEPKHRVAHNRHVSKRH